jgi:hypothetical protein
MSTKKGDTAKLSGLDLYMRALYKLRPFPGVGNDSSIYLNLSATARGNAAVANQKYFNTSAALAAHFALHFLQVLCTLSPLLKFGLWLIRLKIR